MNKKIIPVIIGVLAIAIALVIVFMRGASDGAQNQNVNQATTTPETSVETYTNSAYGFQLQHPSDWTVTENAAIPSISIHRKSDPAGSQYGIHQNTTGVTIYPKGLGTEPPQSQYHQAAINFLGASTTLTDFVLKDGQLWAELVYVPHGLTAKGWSRDAFIWAGLEVKDAKVTCVTKDGVEKPAESCDMGIESSGSTFVRTGTTTPTDGAYLELILRTFQFTE
jgi:hypothetical protein